MTTALLALAEPRRTRGGAGGVRPNRPGRRAEQTVWIPEVLFRGANFCDEAVLVYAKLAALDARRSCPGSRGTDIEPCTASVSALAEACGVSKSTAERGLRALNSEGPDGETPWAFTKRRTHKGGTGRTAYRAARLVPADEAALQVPVRAAEALGPRLFRAWLHLMRATALGLPVTAAELAGELFHHTGANAGAPLGERTGRRLMAELDRLGWITLDPRAGRQGRHLITVNTTPLHAVGQPGAIDEQPPATATAQGPSADIHDGSGADDHDGSVASKEDSGVTTDVEAQVVGGIRRRRGTGSKPVDNPGDQLPAAFAARDRGLRPERTPHPNSTPASPPYTGPGLQLSPRVWTVLEPVRHELPGIRPFLLRRIAHAIGRQLDDGTTAERLTARLTHRYASTEDPRCGDVGRWILGAGLPRRGCGLADCESGTLWHSGERCQVCLDNALHKAQQQQRQAPPAPPATAAPPRPPRAAPAAVDDDRWRPGLPPRPESTAPVLTRAEKALLRASATPEAVRAAIDQHGQAAAVDLYGRALVFPLVLVTGSEGDAREAR
ncbi:hypothetical protein ACIBJC_15135 [Streptomyces sp. NPDC050509]|uniref:hypothetical protein n=1 Tax=Streptomyces sp. NPDC050509 TaxID=3365620 RepID=UPI00378D3D9C